MENATKALLIAGGVLIAIIIISVMVVTFQKTGNVSKTYKSNIDEEEITKFNTNFTKYVGEELNIQQANSITNFDKNNNEEVINGKTTADITDKNINKKMFKLIILNDNDDGYINKVQISE